MKRHFDGTKHRNFSALPNIAVTVAQGFFIFDLGFTALSRIFQLYRVDHSMKVVKNQNTHRKNYLIFCNQNLSNL